MDLLLLFFQARRDIHRGVEELTHRDGGVLGLLNDTRPECLALSGLALECSVVWIRDMNRSDRISPALADKFRGELGSSFRGQTVRSTRANVFGAKQFVVQVLKLEMWILRCNNGLIWKLSLLLFCASHPLFDGIPDLAWLGRVRMADRDKEQTPQVVWAQR